MTWKIQPSTELTTTHKGDGSHPELISQFRIRLQLPVVGTASVTTHKTPVLIFNGILAGYVRIHNGPH